MLIINDYGIRSEVRGEGWVVFDQDYGVKSLNGVAEAMLMRDNQHGHFIKSITVKHSDAHVTLIQEF